MSIKILAFGEILWDIIEGEPKIGGAPLNFAGHAHQLGAESALVSAVGKDELGDRALVYLDSLGVDTRRVFRSNLPTGEAPVILTDGIPEFTILENRAWDAVRLSSEEIDSIASEGWDVLYYGTLGQRSEASRTTLRNLWETGSFPRRFYDVNLRQHYYGVEILRPSLEAATMVKLNDEEVVVLSELLFGEVTEGDGFVERLRTAFDLDLICLTYGAEGAVIYHGNGEKTPVAPKPVEAVDTVGAGDSFSAALVTGLCLTGDVARAGAMAQSLASFVVTQPGAIQPYPESLKRELGLL